MMMSLRRCVSPVGLSPSGFLGFGVWGVGGARNPLNDHSPIAKNEAWTMS